MFKLRAGVETGGKRIDNPPQIANLPHNLALVPNVHSGGMEKR